MSILCCFVTSGEDEQSNWGIASNGDVVPGEPQAADFSFEFDGQTKFHIRAPNGNYLTGESNGLFTAKSADKGDKTRWEY